MNKKLSNNWLYLKIAYFTINIQQYPRLSNLIVSVKLKKGRASCRFKIWQLKKSAPSLSAINDPTGNAECPLKTVNLVKTERTKVDMETLQSTFELRIRGHSYKVG